MNLLGDQVYSVLILGPHETDLVERFIESSSAKKVYRNPLPLETIIERASLGTENPDWEVIVYDSASWPQVRESESLHTLMTRGRHSGLLLILDVNGLDLLPTWTRNHWDIIIAFPPFPDSGFRFGDLVCKADECIVHNSCTYKRYKARVGKRLK